MKINLNNSAAIPAHYMNRHALVTGATGTGKTVSILTLVESLSALGVPVIAPDVKGDLPQIAASCPAKILAPARGLSLPIWRLGADLMARALELSEVQAGALEIAFTYAEDSGIPLNSLQDLRGLLLELAERPELAAHYGYMTRASIGTIQRGLLRLERSGQAGVFGPECFDIESAMRSGLVTILDASGLYKSPRVYGAVMLWLLREIAERFPECGDLEKPRLALVIDESHALFQDASPALIRAIEGTARLIRSKGVALIFASQAPEDLPPVVQAQCATRLIHSRQNGVGNAQFVTLDARGNMTAPALIRPSLPRCFSLPPKAPEEAAPSATPSKPPSVMAPPIEGDNMDSAGYAFLGITGLALLGVGYWLGGA